MKNASKLKILGIASLAALFSMSTASTAAIFTLGLATNDGTDGLALESGALVFGGGVTLTPDNNGGDAVNAVSTAFGLGTGGTIDGADQLTFTFDFGAYSVTLLSIDFDAVGSSPGTDEALVNVAGSLFTLGNGGVDFDGSDVWTPNSGAGIVLATSDTIVFTAEDSYTLRTISFDVTSTAAPEPSSLALLGMGAVFLARKKKRLSAHS